jgi:quinol monooxygenase YgiN
MRYSPIVELRQYTLRPGQRDVLIDLFEANFVESQEDTGMKVIGTFRDLDDPTRFVWLRGFDTMDSRARSLGDFYDGPVWRRHRDRANETMVDSDNVLLLRPAGPTAGFVLPSTRPAASATGDRDGGIVEVLVVALDAPADADTIDRLTTEIAASVVAAGGIPLARFVTEESENTFPRLPVREDEHIYAFFAGYPSREQHTAQQRRDEIERATARAAPLKNSPVMLRLLPTRRSLLTGAAPETSSTRARDD